jgi:hypothetical protein
VHVLLHVRRGDARAVAAGVTSTATRRPRGRRAKRAATGQRNGRAATTGTRAPALPPPPPRHQSPRCPVNPQAADVHHAPPSPPCAPPPPLSSPPPLRAVAAASPAPRRAARRADAAAATPRTPRTCSARNAPVEAVLPPSCMSFCTSDRVMLAAQSTGVTSSRHASPTRKKSQARRHGTTKRTRGNNGYTGSCPTAAAATPPVATVPGQPSSCRCSPCAAVAAMRVASAAVFAAAAPRRSRRPPAPRRAARRARRRHHTCYALVQRATHLLRWPPSAARLARRRGPNRSLPPPCRIGPRRRRRRPPLPKGPAQDHGANWGDGGAPHRRRGERGRGAPVSFLVRRSGPGKSIVLSQSAFLKF